MTERPRPAPKTRRARAADRQGGDYQPPILAEPAGGPVPTHVGESEATRAGGAEQLKRYWLAGEGLAKWNTWTELYAHLRKYLPPERAKRTAAEWFHERFGFWPGADVNRVRQGKPPRGDKVGPG